MLTRQAGGLQYEWLQIGGLGKGGFGEVYKCIETNTALLIAVKEVNATSEERKKMVMKEINFMRTLRHVSFCLLQADDIC